MKILLLEDDDLLADTIKELLETKNFKVDTTPNSLDAEEMTLEKRYDLYLLDVNVQGGMSGFKLAEELRKEGDKTPIIFMTALTDIKSLTRAYDIGIDDYLKKPLDPYELLLRINSRMKLNRKDKIEYKHIEYILNEKEIKVESKSISLGNIEQIIIQELLLNIDKTIDKNYLLELMETDNEVALRVLINKLKKKLNIEITNIRGIGYKLEK